MSNTFTIPAEAEYQFTVRHGFELDPENYLDLDTQEEVEDAIFDELWDQLEDLEFTDTEGSCDEIEHYLDSLHIDIPEAFWREWEKLRDSNDC